MSETAKYRHLVSQYCTGNGCDIGSGGDPVVPWAIQVDLPEAEYAKYNSGHTPEFPIQYRASNAALELPFKDETLDWVFSSHVLEDFRDWVPALMEWARVIRRGGFLVIILPDKQRWEEALRRGQRPNNAHQHESFVGELSSHADCFGWRIIEDRLTDLSPEDYSIFGVFQKL